MDKTETERQARELAEGFGFIEWLPVIAALISGLVTWWQKCKGEEPTPAESIQSRYDEATGEYDRDLVNKGMKKVRKTARKKRVKMTASQVREVVIGTLDKARTASAATVGKVLKDPRIDEEE